jgi:hypothetical protein
MTCRWSNPFTYSHAYYMCKYILEDIDFQEQKCVITNGHVWAKWWQFIEVFQQAASIKIPEL